MGLSGSKNKIFHYAPFCTSGQLPFLNNKTFMVILPPAVYQLYVIPFASMVAPVISQTLASVQMDSLVHSVRMAIILFL